MRKINKQIDEYLGYCKEIRGMSPVTILNKRYILENFVMIVGIRDLRQFTNKVFDEWVMKAVERKVGASSINTYSATVFAMVKYHKEIGVKVPLKINIVKKKKAQKVQRKFYSTFEVEKVIALADDETGLMIRIMFETGMRIAELTRLRIGDFDSYRIRFVGKGQKLREVYISEKTLVLLREFVEEVGVCDYLWGARSVDGRPPTVNTVRNRMEKVFDAAGYKGFYPHALRHSFATNLQIRGASMSEIKEMMGHESIATTERYLHGFEGRLSELFKKYQ